MVVRNPVRVGVVVGALAVALVSSACCTGSQAEQGTQAFVGQIVEVTKGAATGAAHGFDDGRKRADSVDDAVVVANAEDFGAVGTVSVASIVEMDGGYTIALVFENTSERPVRLTHLAPLVLDADGVVIECRAESQWTVPPRAKLEVPLTVTKAGARTVRVYGVELAVPDASRAM